MAEGMNLILGFVSNLMFSTRIDSVAARIGFITQWINSPDGWDVPQIDTIQNLSPSLIVVDLGMEGINWTSWIRQVKSNPTTLRIPLICFGSHLDTDTFRLVKQAGANQVLARSRFFSSLPDIIQKNTNF